MTNTIASHTLLIALVAGSGGTGHGQDLPAEKIVVEADSYNPPNKADTPPTAIPNLVHFISAVDRLALDVEQLVPIHGRSATYTEACKAAEVYGSTQLWGNEAGQPHRKD